MATAIERAIEKAKQENLFPDIGPGMIIRYSCPDRWGVGVQPGWCEIRKHLGKTCNECWNQESGESDERMNGVMILNSWLSAQQAESTRKAYEKDIKYFFPKGEDTITDFLSLSKKVATEKFSAYKQLLINKSLSPATINRRLSAVRSLVYFCQEKGLCEFDLRGIKGLKDDPYEKKSGFSPIEVSLIFSAIETEVSQGNKVARRDRAMFLLIYENLLRRNEVFRANIEDFNAEERTLTAYKKGSIKKTAERLSVKTVNAIVSWIEVYGEANPTAPLFVALDNKNNGRRLSLSSATINDLLRYYSKKAGIRRTVSSTMFRRCKNTQEFEEGIKKIGRWKKFATAQIYNDKRKDYNKMLFDAVDGDGVNEQS